MSSSWSAEKWRMLLIVSVGFVLGMLTQKWAMSMLIIILLYLLWTLRQLYKMERWLRDGAHSKNLPIFSGGWNELLYYINALQRRHSQGNKRLKRILKRFRKTAAALPDATVVLNEYNEIEWVSDVASDLLGIKKPNDIGQRIHNLIRAPEFHQYLQARQFDEPLQIESPVDDEIQLDLRIIKFNDGQRLLTARDISGFMRIQAMRRDFIANVSHEMRTPLTVMSGYLESLVEEKELPDEYRPIIESINVQTDRLQCIVEELLELSSLESDHSSLYEEKVSVVGLLTALKEDAERVAEGSGHIISLSVSDDAPDLRGSTKELHSLCSNLIFNAIRHTPPGTEIQIEWSIIDQNERSAVLSVVDNGPGIEAQHLSRLTERFYRVDPGRARDSGGTGLGLSIAKHIMLRHGGQLEIESIINTGSSFICKFPQDRLIFRQIESGLS